MSEATQKTLGTPSREPLLSPASLSSLPTNAPAQFAESAKLEPAIKANLKGLGYGG